MKKILSTIAWVGLGSLSAFAGSATWDFNTDPTTDPSPLTLLGNGNGGGDWVPYGGVTGGDSDGYLSVTGPTTGQWAKIFFPDMDNGTIVAAFTFECMLRIGNGTDNPADGFSINYARATDPTFTKDGDGLYQNGGWSGTANEPGSTDGSMGGLPEEGTITGLAIGFDSYNSASALWPTNLNGSLDDVVGISVRVDNKVVAQVPLATLHGACADNTSLQTGPRNPDDSSDFSVLCWQPFKVQLTEDGHLSVWWKGRAVVDNIEVDFAPSAGRLVFGGRTGSLYQNQHVDSIVLTTIPASKAVVGTPTADALGVTATIDDSGDSVVDAATLTMTVDGVAVAPLTTSKTGVTTTIRWNSAPVYMTSGDEVAVGVAGKDTRGVQLEGTHSATVAAYTMIPPAYKAPAGSVDTAKTGFLMRPYQTEASQPNSLLWTEEQLLGFRGANLANLSGASGGFFTHATVVNFSMAAPTAVGNFSVDNGSTDEMFPGFPGTTDGTGNASEEVLTYIDFPAWGLYHLGVNSDDGFRVTAGRAPGDLLGTVLGYYDGGRGASDTIFSVLIDQPGIYPIRLIWENGTGELPDNGANLEFFSVKDGVKTLINGTGANALKAYRESSAAVPFLSSITPQRGTTGIFADAPIAAEISNGSVQVDSSSVKVKLNGADRAATVASSGSKTTVTVTPAGLLPSGSTQTVTIEFKDNATTPVTYTAEWQFTVGAYSVLTEDLWTAPGTGDATKPGLSARIWQVDQPGTTALINRAYRAEQELAGIIGANVADLSLATDGVFAIDLVNWNQDATGIGSFPNDETPIPGIPGAGSKPDDSIAGEVITYIDIPNAGYHSMGVFCDDGFKVTVADAPPANNLALIVTGAASAAGSYHTVSGPDVTSKPFTSEVKGNLVYMDPAQGCTAPVNAAALLGNIALVDRGTCEFSLKLKAAKDAGAIGVIVVNNRAVDHAEGVFPTELGLGSAGYQDIPAVMISMPDGDKIKTGLASGLTASLTPDTTPAVGQVDGSTGADTIFNFVAPKAGVYPFRCVWWEGAGGANLEWFSMTPLHEKILVNDLTNAAALKGYRARTATPQTKPTISIAVQGANVVVTFTGTLQAADEVTGSWGDVSTTSPYTAPVAGSAKKFLRSRK